MKVRAFFVGACLTAAVLPALLATAPALQKTPTRPNGPADQPAVSWPTHFRGRPLTQLALTPLEARFAARFPGALARFSIDAADGRQTLIVRHVTQPTRQLHPAVDCFRAAGYTVGKTEPKIDADGRRWRCFIAQRSGGRDLRVCERIAVARPTHAAASDADANANAWTDVSAWYWHAMWHGGGPWQALTLVSRL